MHICSKSSPSLLIRVESMFNNDESSSCIYYSNYLLLLFTLMLFFLANIHYQHGQLPSAICCLSLYRGRRMGCLRNSFFPFSSRELRKGISYSKAPLSWADKKFRLSILVFFLFFHEYILIVKQIISPMPLKRKEAIFPIQPYVYTCLICLLTALKPSLNSV